jgi:formylglycine-generating enzyme required for sulfatase activity
VNSARPAAWAATLALVTSLVPAPVRAEPAKVVAVFAVESTVASLRPSDLDTLTEVIATRMTASGAYKVVPKSDLKRALTEQKKTSFERCYDESCQIEVGKEVAANLSLASRLSSLGSRCLLTLNLYDLRLSASAGAAMAEGGCAVEAVLDTVKAAVDQLVGPQGGRAVEPVVVPPDRDVRAGASSTARALEVHEVWGKVSAVAGDPGVARAERARLLESFLAEYGPIAPQRAEAEAMLAQLKAAASNGLTWLASAFAGIELTRTEVTVAEYARCVDAGGCDGSRLHGTEYQGKAFAPSPYCNWGERASRGNHPVNCVTHREAEAFCRWAGGRLPSADEWGAEASAGGTRTYPWGEAAPTCARAVMKGEGNDGCGQDRTWPVCSKPAGNSVSGLCDLGGNLWEWTSTVEGAKRVNVGASWIAGEADSGRFAARFRSSDPEDYRGNGMGFRCARGRGGTVASSAVTARTASQAALSWVQSPSAGVTFTRSEITVAEYERCAAAGACATGRVNGTEFTDTASPQFTESGYCNWARRSERGTHPMNCVNHAEAEAFCRWAGGRLPTAAEWFAEAHDGGVRKYPWGSEEPSCKRAVMHGEGEDGCGQDRTWPVCSKPSGHSASGLCDLGGNVAEWTSTAQGQKRVKVGATWLSRSAGRFLNGATSPDDPRYRGNGIGFRCVLDR